MNEFIDDFTLKKSKSVQRYKKFVKGKYYSLDLEYKSWSFKSLHHAKLETEIFNVVVRIDNIYINLTTKGKLKHNEGYIDLTVIMNSDPEYRLSYKPGQVFHWHFKAQLVQRLKKL